MDFGILDQLEDPDKRPKKKRKGRYNTGLDDVDPGQAARATGNKSMAGQYKRWTITVRPAMLSYIKEAAASQGLSQLEFVRWLLDRGLMAYEDGDRPEVEPRVVLGRAKKEHWSSGE